MQALVTLCMSDIGRLLGTLGLLSLGITLTLWGLKHRWYRPHPLWIWGLGSLLLVILLWIPQLVTAEDSVEVLTVRYQDEGRIALVAGGVGMRYPTGWPSNPEWGIHRGDIILDVPGTVRQAYLYWGGYDDEQVGDDTVSLTVDGVTTTTITADWTHGPASWDVYWRYVYVAEVDLGLVQPETHRYTVSGFDEMVSDTEGWDGAGLMVVYEDSSLPYNRVEIRDGLDRFFRGWYNPLEEPNDPSAETAITCFDFEPSLVDRLMDITMFVGGVNISQEVEPFRTRRPSALWYITGTVGIPPTDIIFEGEVGDEDHDPGATLLQGLPDSPSPFRSLDGSEWDTYTNSIPIDAGVTWACIQVESSDYSDDTFSYNPASGVEMTCGVIFQIDGFEIAAIGDYVWYDVNLDGIQDDGESGVPDVTVNLYDGMGTFVISTTTDINGVYHFTDLAPGDYYLEFEPPAGYTISPQDQGGDDDKDSDADPNTGQTIITTLDPGEDDLSWDAGLARFDGIELSKTVYLCRDDGGAGCPGSESVTGAKGAHVTYCFEVTNINTDTIWLDDITINDPALGIDETQMTWLRGSTPLAPGDSLVYYYEGTISGDLVNTAMVTGTSPAGTVSDTDTATVKEESKPATIELAKTVYRDHDGGAGCPGSDSVTGKKHELVTYCFEVTNTGNTYLDDITIADDALGIDETQMTWLRGSTPLAPGDSLVYYYEGTINGDLVNKAKTQGIPTDAEGNDLPCLAAPTDEDTAEVVGKKNDDGSTTPPTVTRTPTSTPTLVTPTATVLIVERLPETGRFPGGFTVFLGVLLIIGAASILNLALLEKRGRRGDGKGH